VAETIESIPLAAARRLFLHGQGLRSDPEAPATVASVFGQIQRLGFVQLDSINIVERAHHHILWTRLHQYRPPLLDRLQQNGRVFEHWTHDASIIPSEWFPHWRHRFQRVTWEAWIRRRMGAGHRELLAAVLDRIRREGPLLARDFEQHGHRSGAWWDWKPAKAALEYWWRTGELAIPRRMSFQKMYDLTERVLPRVHGLPTPATDEHVDWACRTAIQRLGVATPRELAAFWGAIGAPQAAAWCKAAAARGELVPAEVKAKPGSHRAPAPAFARADWRDRAAEAADAPPGMRLLSPFDPLIRDRARCLRLFGFDYRFEAFVPEAKRKHGYYVLPILQGERLVGRLDPKLDREAGVLRVRRVWWEPGVKPTAGRRRELAAALDRYAAFVGARSVEVAGDGR
jgi:uncharacterized protein YcaQ